METPYLGVLIPAEGEGFGSSKYVYPECLLKSSIRLLRPISEIRIPEDVAALVRRGYDAAEVPEKELPEWYETIIRNQVEGDASQQYLINPPDKQYSALIDPILYDDNDQIITVKTRLGELTTRVALLEPPLYERLQPYLKTKNGEVWAEVWNKEIAEQVMLQSLSLTNRRLYLSKNGQKTWPESNKSTLWYINGGKLLAGTRIIRLENGSAPLDDGKRIRNDPELGILIKEGEL